MSWALLGKIDELLLAEHFFLDVSDECYFLREYTAGRGYGFSATNNLILNFKKSPTVRATPQWPHKQQALDQFAAELRAAIQEEWLRQVTLVPIPPSKVPAHPEYDDRLLQLLHKLGPGNLDIRQLLRQETSTEPAHIAPHRPRLETLLANYRIEESLLHPRPNTLILVDDVLTTGAHFKAAKRLLHLHLPNTPLLGLFLARTVRLEQAGDSPQLP